MMRRSRWEATIDSLAIGVLSVCAFGPTWKSFPVGLCDCSLSK